MVNQTLLELIFREPIEDFVVLDVGCGQGALTFAIAGRAKHVIGIDISGNAIIEARKHAKENTTFHVMDADEADYSSLGAVDMVVSHLCMSDEIVENSFKALPPGSVLAFACFHSKHLIEGGRQSRFSYSEEEMSYLLVKTGFTVEYLEVETEKVEFKDRVEAMEILGKRTVERWRIDRRLRVFLEYIESRGRHITMSTLVGKARKTKE